MLIAKLESFILSAKNEMIETRWNRGFLDLAWNRKSKYLHVSPCSNGATRETFNPKLSFLCRCRYSILLAEPAVSPSRIRFILKFPIFSKKSAKFWNSIYKNFENLNMINIFIFLLYADFSVKRKPRKLDNFRKATHLRKKRRTSGDEGNSSSLDCGSYVMKNDKRSRDST